MSATTERVCVRCRLVYVEAIPSASIFAGVCPRCGLVADLGAVSRPSSGEEPKS